jgi:hypothetical protein
MPQRTAHIRLGAMVAAAAAALALFALVAAAPTYAKTAHASGKTVHVIEHAITDTEVPGVGGKGRRS